MTKPTAAADSNLRPPTDAVIQKIAAYVLRHKIEDEDALATARLCLMDSVGCAFAAWDVAACRALLGPVVPGASLAGGARVIGGGDELDPIKAAFDNGTLIRWLDFNDTWLAAEWGHPSDNLGAILALGDYLARNGKPLAVADILPLMVKAHEIQGVLALANAFNRAGLDHVLLVKVASTAVCCALLELDEERATAALANAWADGQALRVYRHAPNTGSRKSWAAGDAASRGARLALLAQAGVAHIPSALTAPGWGFCDASLRGRAVELARDFDDYVMKNILFKVSFPAEFHAQTAVECALALHPQARDRIDEIARIRIDTQESAARIISKTGPLHNPADRDHCLQYMVACGLIFGDLRAAHYEDSVAADPRIDALRAKMEVFEEPRFSRDYLDPSKRSIANAVEIFFADGSSGGRVEVEYPLGHRRRRAESLPHLRAKFLTAAEKHLPQKAAALADLFADSARLDKTPLADFMGLIAAD